MFVIPADLRDKKARRTFLEKTGTIVKDGIEKLQKELEERKKLVEELMSLCAEWEKEPASEKFPEYFGRKSKEKETIPKYFARKEKVGNKYGISSCSDIAGWFKSDYLKEAPEITAIKEEICKREGFLDFGIEMTGAFLQEGDLHYEKIQNLPYHKMMKYYERYFYHNEDMNKLELGGQKFFTEKGILSPWEIAETNPERPFYDEIVKWLNRCFPYDRFIKMKECEYGPYDLCRDLGVRICIYCNINYTYTIDDSCPLEEEGGLAGKADPEGKRSLISRPDLDHFFPRSAYPMFQMSFENLIPSCSICNSRIKRDRAMDIKKCLHPYQKKEPEMKFYLDNKHKVKMVFGGNEKEKEKVRNTVEFFRTKEVYGFFRDEAEKIRQKSEIYTAEYLDELEKYIPEKERKDREQFVRDLFGYVEPENIMNTSLGKLRHDLTEVIVDSYKR